MLTGGAGASGGGSGFNLGSLLQGNDNKMTKTFSLHSQWNKMTGKCKQLLEYKNNFYT